MITLAEWESIKEQEIEEEKEEDVEGDLEETQEDIEEDAAEGVLRRLLNGQKGAKDEQKENIFHSRCTFKGRFVP